MSDLQEPTFQERRTIREVAPPDVGWHLDKKVPLTLIFAMMVQAAMVVWAIADIKKDVEVLKMQSAAQAARDTRQDDEMHEAMRLLREQFMSMNAKLDRLIERTPR